MKSIKDKMFSDSELKKDEIVFISGGSMLATGGTDRCCKHDDHWHYDDDECGNPL